MREVEPYLLERGWTNLERGHEAEEGEAGKSGRSKINAKQNETDNHLDWSD
jgi:hypothetical protein